MKSIESHALEGPEGAAARAAAEALKAAQEAAAAMETSRPAVWVEVDPDG